jgi:glycosyltransferase involved in cell wall biosynthesis
VTGRALRIAHVDTGRTWRGGQAQVLLLMRELRALGHVQRLLAPPGPLLEQAAAAGLDVAPWRSHGELDAGAMLAAWRALKAFAPDVAHLHTAHAHALATWPARAAGVPGVVVSRRVDFKVATHPLSRLKYGWPVDRYFCVSRGVMQAMRASGVAEERLALVPDGIDIAAVRAGADAPAPDLRALLGLGADAEVVGTVASLAPHKNHALLLEAAPLVLRARPRARFVWLGEGDCRPALERRRAELGLEDRVILAGFHPQVHALTRQFDLFVLSSYLEGLCTSLLDAQVLGVPIVATAVGGVPEVVQDGVTGSLVGALEPGPLAAAIVDALEHPDRRAAWAAAGREAVTAFTSAATARRSVEEYAGLLDRHGPLR